VPPPVAEDGNRAIGSGSLVVEQHVLTNAALNFAGFLLRAVMPTTLHVIIAIATANAIGDGPRIRFPVGRCPVESTLLTCSHPVVAG